jgi:chromosomal replication initiation ATPase DnaA
MKINPNDRVRFIRTNRFSMYPLGKLHEPTISWLKLFCDITHLTGVSIAEIKSNSRKTNIRFARQLFHYLSYHYISNNLSQIARITNIKSHSTIIHSIRIINNIIDTQKPKDQFEIINNYNPK